MFLSVLVLFCCACLTHFVCTIRSAQPELALVVWRAMTALTEAKDVATGLAHAASTTNSQRSGDMTANDSQGRSSLPLLTTSFSPPPPSTASVSVDRSAGETSHIPPVARSFVLLLLFLQVLLILSWPPWMCVESTLCCDTHTSCVPDLFRKVL